MTKIDIISGFLGAGKTTLIKKLLEGPLKGQQIVLIENEFGEIGIDGGFLKESGVQINEMTSGCICCSLVGDFGQALRDVLTQFTPDRILIEPSGVGKLSDVAGAVRNVSQDIPVTLSGFVTVVDAKKCKMYLKNFGEFFGDQVDNAGAIFLSRTQELSEEQLHAIVALLRERNPKARIVTTPWEELTGEQTLSVMEESKELSETLMEERAVHVEAEDGEEHHHHHHHDHEHDHDHHHEHDHEHEHHEHEHHHDHEHEHHHDHEHEHDEACSCGHHHHHHGHDADEIFTSWGQETPRKYTQDEIRRALDVLDGGKVGTVLRAKGIVACADGGWLEFDFVPGETEIRSRGADYTGRLCVIGSELDEPALVNLFHLS